MILLALLQAAAPLPPMPPADWSTLPDLPVQAIGGAFDPSAFVKREVAAGRCRAAAHGAGRQVDAQVAVLVDQGGALQRIVPQAIGCPTVEQFTVGLVSTLARRAAYAGALRPGWYRYVATYRWAG